MEGGLASTLSLKKELKMFLSMEGRNLSNPFFKGGCCTGCLEAYFSLHTWQLLVTGEMILHVNIAQ